MVMGITRERMISLQLSQSSPLLPPCRPLLPSPLCFQNGPLGFQTLVPCKKIKATRTIQQQYQTKSKNKIDYSASYLVMYFFDVHFFFRYWNIQCSHDSDGDNEEVAEVVEKNTGNVCNWWALQKARRVCNRIGIWMPQDSQWNEEPGCSAQFYGDEVITNYDICRHLRETKGRLRLKNRTYFNHVYIWGVFSCFHDHILFCSMFPYLKERCSSLSLSTYVVAQRLNKFLRSFLKDCLIPLPSRLARRPVMEVGRTILWLLVAWAFSIFLNDICLTKDIPAKLSNTKKPISITRRKFFAFHLDIPWKEPPLLGLYPKCSWLHTVLEGQTWR